MQCLASVSNKSDRGNEAANKKLNNGKARPQWIMLSLFNHCFLNCLMVFSLPTNDDMPLLMKYAQQSLLRLRFTKVYWWIVWKHCKILKENLGCLDFHFWPCVHRAVSSRMKENKGQTREVLSLKNILWVFHCLTEEKQQSRKERFVSHWRGKDQLLNLCNT